MIKIQDYCTICGNDVSDLGTQVCHNCKEGGVFSIGLTHTKKDCVKNGKWKEGEFRCQKCNRLIAFAYKIGNEIKVWKFPNFKTANVGKPDYGFIGEINFTDFTDYVNFLKQDFQNEKDKINVVSDD